MNFFQQVLAVGLVCVGIYGYRNGWLDKAGPPAPAPTGELAQLVPDAEHRAQLGAFYRAFSQVVAEGACDTLGDFRTAQQTAVKTAKAAGKLPDLSVLNAPIEARIKAAVGGLADVKLDAAQRSALSSALAGIAAEFGG